MDLRSLGQLVRYGVTGIVSVGAYVGSLWIMVHVSLIPEAAANAVAYIAATLLNYVLNFYWSFGSKQTHGLASTKFLAVALSGLVLNSAFVSGATTWTEIPVVWAATIFAVIWPLVSFAAQKLWVFRS